MFYSSGYFKHIGCPFLISGLCERHFCHFRHTNCVKVDSFIPIQKAESEINGGYLYSRNYLPSLNENEYNPVNFINEIKPSYSPASYISSGTSSQSIQTETAASNLQQSQVNNEPKQDEIIITKLPKHEKFDENSQNSVKSSISTSNKGKRKLHKTIKEKHDLNEKMKIQKLEQIYHSIFDSSDQEEKANEIQESQKRNKMRKSIKNDKGKQILSKSQHVKVDQSVANGQQRMKPEPKSQEIDELTEMEEALISGRYKGRRLTMQQILQFRMIIADRRK